jgi:hypothetical protein
VEFTGDHREIRELGEKNSHTDTMKFALPDLPDLPVMHSL